MIVCDDNRFFHAIFLCFAAIAKPIIIILLCLATIILWTVPATANNVERILEADGPKNSPTLSQHIDFYKDSSWEKTIENLTGHDSDEFVPIQTASPDFGFTKDRIWLRVKAVNKTQTVNTWYIYTHENFLQHYDVYIQRENGDIIHAESHTPSSHFSERFTPNPQLTTRFEFLPREQVAIFIAYNSGGSSKMSISLETRESFARKSVNQTSKVFISYGMMVILMVVSFLGLIILRQRVISIYLLYVGVTLLFLMHGDGVAFQYLWPQNPWLNSYFSIIIGLAFAIVPYNFAREFLRTKTYHPVMDKIMVVMMIATPVIIIPCAFIDPQFTKKILMPLVLLAIALGTWAGFLASFKRFKEVRFYLFAWILGVSSAGVMNLRHFTDMDINQNMELDSIRVSIVVDAIMMGLGVADRYLQDIKKRRASEQQALLQAKQNLTLNTRLFDLEEQYKLVTELAASRDQTLKDTVHDLREPLHALRLNIQNLREGGEFTGPDDESANFEETFSYLESLIADSLQSSVMEVGATAKVQSSPDSELSLPSILKSIHQMFLPDAEQKGLRFRYVETSAQSSVDPLVLMRIVTNLVSNAIKYTPSGTILLGVRRTREGGARVEVHDTGPGMTDEEFSMAQLRAVRLDDENTEIVGHGYGLNIVSQLAKKHDLHLSKRERRKTGTSIAFEVRPSSK